MRLQGHQLTLSQQQTHVNLLSGELLLKITVVRNFDFENVDESAYVIRNNGTASYIDITGFIEDLGHFAVITINSLSEPIWQVFLWNVVFFIFDIVDGFMNCITLQDERGSSSDMDCPPLYPFELVKLKGRDISHLIIQQKSRLDCSWSLFAIDKIGSQFSELCTMYKNVLACREAIDTYDHQCSFDDAWSLLCLSGRFIFLLDFVGGLGLPFPNTAHVESDFSMLKFMKNVFNMSLTNFSLEEFLQCKQYDLLRTLKQ